VNYDPDRDTDDWPAIPLEDRWFEDPADPSPSLMRDLPPYPAEPAYAEDVVRELRPPSGWVALGAAVAVAMLVYAADRWMGGR
jgi:hypothetical protein